MTDEARLAAWHRNVYESYDEPEDGCPECGGPLTVERDPDGGDVYCKTCLECPNCGGPYEPDLDKPVCSECMDDPHNLRFESVLREEDDR